MHPTHTPLPRQAGPGWAYPIAVITPDSWSVSMIPDGRVHEGEDDA